MRLTPVLLIKGSGLVKTKKFSDSKYVGDLVNTARLFNDKEADELTLLDVEASVKGTPPNFGLIEEVVSECFLPISYGGGVSSPKDAKRLVDCGVDKVVVNSFFLSNPSVLREISDAIGSSSTVASLDVIATDGKFAVRNAPGKDFSDVVKSAVDYGAGELLIQDVLADGTKSGPNLGLARQVLSITDLPVMFGGGVSSLDQAKQLWGMGIGAVAAGAWFVFNGPHDAILVTYPSRKKIDEAISAVELPKLGL
jgi:cyclase